MKYKKNRFVIFYIFNLILLLILLILAIPLSKFLSKINFEDNEFVSDQTVISSKVESPKIIDREINIRLDAKVDPFLEWNFKALKNNVKIKMWIYHKLKLCGWCEM